MRSTLLLLLTATIAFAADDEIHVMPKYEVSDDVIAAMIPCEQINELSEEAKRSCPSFDLSVVTVIKAPESRFAKSVRCYIRNKDGHVLRELTNDSLLFPVDRNWPKGFLSSNQPTAYASFYFMLQPKLGPGAPTLGALGRLFREYSDFSERRINDAIRFYGAQGSWAIELRWATQPDEVVLVAATPAAAAAIAHRLNLSASGRVVLISENELKALTVQYGASFAVADAAGDIDCITPWRSIAALPPFRDHAALFHLGWVQYTPAGSTTPQHDFIALGLDPAPN